MLKTCSHCGIVNDNHVCPFSKRKKKSTDAHNIRQTNKWHKKSIEIRERDNYLCRICLLELFDTKLKYNPNELEVHHIEPLEFSPDLAFEDDNLISLCRFHHEKAEIGDIPKVLLKEIVLKDIRTIPPSKE